MRGLAEYVMLGRRQAIIIVLLCGFFPLLYFFSAAIVALVTLRKGRNEGLIVLLWSMLPAGTLWAMGDSSPMFLMLGTFALAAVLRKTESWQFAILAALAVGLVTQLSLIFQPEYLALVESLVSDGLQEQLNQSGQTEYTVEQIVDLLLSFYGAYHAIMVIVLFDDSKMVPGSLVQPGRVQAGVS